MATVLVDYENVCMKNGLAGTSHLNSGDTLHIFYSAVCEKLPNYHMEEINKSGCTLLISKLIAQGKNALDFYIATECGRLISDGETQIAIVSEDKGYAAVIHYIREVMGMKNIEIFRSSNIENALKSFADPENAERRKIIAERQLSVDLKSEYAKLQERNQIRNEIFSALKGTKYEGKISSIISYLENKDKTDKKKLYTGALHEFGKKDGLELYSILKEVV